jgi:hypothetical protein
MTPCFTPSDGFRQRTALMFAITGNFDGVSRIFAVRATVFLTFLDWTHAGRVRALSFFFFFSHGILLPEYSCNPDARAFSQSPRRVR